MMNGELPYSGPPLDQLDHTAIPLVIVFLAILLAYLLWPAKKPR
jgi:hypothetical protein